MKFDFYAFLAEAERRKAELGISNDEASTEELRNKGGSRSAAKRRLLARAKERARGSGRPAARSYF